jgi:hypothetical protein
MISRCVIGPILNRRNRATAESGNRSGRDAEISESRLELRDVLRDVNATFSRRFARHCVWFRFFATFYAMSRKKTSRKPMLFSLIQRRWFSPVLLGCYDILMDVIICDTLWYLIRPIGRLLKIAFCEMWGIILCSQCRAHVKDYVSKARYIGRSPSIDANSTQFNAFWHQIRHEIDDFRLNPMKIGVEFEKKMYPYLS